MKLIWKMDNQDMNSWTWIDDLYLFHPKVSAHCTCWASDSAQRRRVYKMYILKIFSLFESEINRMIFSIAKSPEKFNLVFS